MAVDPFRVVGQEEGDDGGQVGGAPEAGGFGGHEEHLLATAQLDLPREFVTKVGDTLREETARLIKSGLWPARLLSQQPWNPRVP